MAETLTSSNIESVALTHEQLVQEVRDRSRSIIDEVSTKRFVKGAQIRPDFYLWASDKEVHRSAFAGDEIESQTSYAVLLDSQGGVELRRDIHAYRSQAGQQKDNSWEALVVGADGSVKFIDGNESRRRFDDQQITKLYGPVHESRERIYTEADMNVDQMANFSDSVFHVLEESLAAE